MGLKSLAYLLILLLASAMLNDACAAATPTTDDDVAAAQDNEYLSGSPREELERAGGHDLSAPGVPYLPAVASARPCSTGSERLVAPSGPRLLYLLMSLQR
jgi:hypothetical protein